MSPRDYYQVLGVSRDVDEQALRAAFRKKAAEYHPDRHHSAGEAEKKKLEDAFKEVGQAYDVLGNPEKRARYDRFGHAGSQGGGGAQGSGGGFGDFGDVFGDIFSGMFGGGREARGSDLRVQVELSFEEAARGKELEISLRAPSTCTSCSGSGAKKGSRPSTCQRCGGRGRVSVNQGFFNMVTTCPDCHGRGERVGEPCPDCHGEGRVRRERIVKVAIPAGVDDGMQIRKRGEGEAGGAGVANGDLYVLVRMKPHSIFSRDGADVLCELPISFTLAALGGEVEVPTLDGPTSVKIVPGTQGGKEVRLKGKGVAHLEGRGRGDQRVTVLVETPQHLNAKQKALLEEFSKIAGDENSPRRKSFLQAVRDLF